MVELVGDSGEKGFEDPFVTADGLTLWVDRKGGQSYEVFVGKRANRAEAFGAMKRIPALDNPSYLAPYPTSAREDEVIISADGIRGDIVARTRQVDGGWSATTLDQRSDNELLPTLSADGTELLVVQFAAEGPERFFSVATMVRARNQPGEPWSQMRILSDAPDGGTWLPNKKPIWSTALTPDALGLFFEQDMKVHYLSRRTRAATFFDGTKGMDVPQLDAPGFKSRVRSITADGCEAYLTSDRDGELDVYVAARRK